MSNVRISTCSNKVLYLTCLKSNPSVMKQILVSEVLLFSNLIWYPTLLSNWVNISYATRFDSDTQAIRLGCVQAKTFKNNCNINIV